MRLLLAEDEEDLSRALVAVLKHNNYSVDAVYDGAEALDYIESSDNYDGVILDIMMPKMDGITVLKTIRSHGNSVPVLMLTAKAEIDDRVEGLDSGADDYLTKPFSMKELMARIRAMTRRKADTTDSVLTFGDITLDRSTYILTGPASINNTCSIENSGLHTDTNNMDNGNQNSKIKENNTVDGQVSENQSVGTQSVENQSVGTQSVGTQSAGNQINGIRLANKEYQMLEMLMTNPGQIISADQFMDRIWGYDSEAEQNVVWVYISYLRKKLASVDSAAQIKATRGVGYSIIY
ncbi:response regulator transcription factor [Agathobacter rectalis]|uniref:response regulator transcription factor n=1 Tax=Agathobacter rectalis TaxID=39491 RepID=UPI0027D22F47|nr:response regulator transcription factor [Agathobacter rectalis]MCQ4816089.1 response regulator transcription factor [Agathobacter rectalis]